ncbi:acyl-CoA carboxylase subunit epsilon [Nocardiopsis sp. MG754419]|uniref:acyl-CoA carboxylase subunit epsilon n=1 Tax=Nocardiopsis sp. MG754419 TaxID=2259865 RepID=UPI001BA86ED0|nr:acyl-CoA carboxylase subunit epsilon [Nocardiopsis sp. MG754419]MBR8742935.1 acyl-CoA carboxylase subunit epsilon [Nocardiopsis sp. MG754419]
MSAPHRPQHGPPHLVVVRGEPSTEELAALTAVLTARAAAARAATERPEPPRSTSGWRDRARGVHAPPRPGPGAWRRSTR